MSRVLAPRDLSLVLCTLTTVPFEPLEQVLLKLLSVKTALRLSLASAKRVSHSLAVILGL